MELIERPATIKLPEAWFTGDAWADVVCRAGQILEAHPGDVVWTPPGEEGTEPAPTGS